MSMFAAMINMLYVRYRTESSEATKPGLQDERSLKYIEERAADDGKVNSIERCWFFDQRARNEILAVLDYPVKAIASDVEREKIVMALWATLQNECSKIGDQTMTTVIMSLLTSKPIRDAEEQVKRQASSASAAKSTPSKAASSSRDRTPATKYERKPRHSNRMLMLLPTGAVRDKTYHCV